VAHLVRFRPGGFTLLYPVITCLCGTRLYVFEGERRVSCGVCGRSVDVPVGVAPPSRASTEETPSRTPLTVPGEEALGTSGLRAYASLAAFALTCLVGILILGHVLKVKPTTAPASYVGSQIDDKQIAWLHLVFQSKHIDEWSLAGVETAGVALSRDVCLRVVADATQDHFRQLRARGEKGTVYTQTGTAIEITYASGEKASLVLVCLPGTVDPGGQKAAR
jgi:hypothetical protein